MSETDAAADVRDATSGLGATEYVTVELLGIGVATVAVGAVVFLGLIPGLDVVERGLGAALVGVGVGVAIYSLELVQQKVSLQSLALGVAFIATALTLSTGVWAGILVVWGVAFVAIGLGAYGFVSLSRRGSRG